MADGRPAVRGKYLSIGEKKFYIRGVTYGTFRPDAQGFPFPSQEMVEHDFSRMAIAGINALRVYTPPPLWLLDLAWKYGLYVMVGLPWEQHIAFLDKPDRPSSIERRIRDAVRQYANHPAILCYVVGNEIPSSIVRWYGPQRIEKFIRRLYQAVKSEAPQALVTYVNYPTTKYLHLPFLDFCCFNVYLETPEKLDAYLAELQNEAGDRPLVMAEIGLDSHRNGEAVQSETLQWQIRTIFAAGCAGMFIFAWTDEWYRGGYEIEDWDFGLTRRNREPKPALEAVRSAFLATPFPSDVQWPRISVAVCTHNGARTLRNCLEGLKRLEYPNYEVIVVDDGSTDETAAIAQDYPIRLIQTDHCGLSSARNMAMLAADGEIVAYTDDDASPDPHWLQYLAWTYLHTDYAAVGGPNIPPPEDGPIAECVSNAPGEPVHVLITDCDAEHIPGCNCSFRKDRLMAVGGFDPQFRTAGDDVDVCWRLLEHGLKIGFQPGAMVWHCRRNSLRSYWTQQRGYGRAEALLEAKWPSKYNTVGNVKWAGRIYGRGLLHRLRRERVYHGLWGTAPFQKLYSPILKAAPPALTPEWYLLSLTLAALLISAPWAVMSVAAIPLFIWILIPLLGIAKSIAEAPFLHDKLRYRLLTGGLHIVQPLARLSGRFAQEWRRTEPQKQPHWAALRSRVLRIWSEQWNAPEDWLRSLEALLVSENGVVRRGDDFDNWDLETLAGMAGAARLKIGIEEHGAGKQMVLFRLWPRVSWLSLAVPCLFAFVSAVAFFDQHFWIGSFFGILVLLVVFRVFTDCSVAIARLHDSVERLTQRKPAANQGVNVVVYLGSS
jgi:glycosyltransferase involved in cell wall biosynthesis